MMLLKCAKHVILPYRQLFVIVIIFGLSSISFLTNVAYTRRFLMTMDRAVSTNNNNKSSNNITTNHTSDFLYQLLSSPASIPELIPQQQRLRQKQQEATREQIHMIRQYGNPSMNNSSSNNNNNTILITTNHTSGFLNQLLSSPTSIPAVTLPKQQRPQQQRKQQEEATLEQIHDMMQPYTYRNPTILQNGCIMTVVLLEPILRAEAYVTLESVAANVHPKQQICVVIQTSLCHIQKTYRISNETMAYHVLIESIYNASRPLFRQWIIMGHVRVTIFRHHLYGTKSCSDFRSVNAVFLNYHYWSHYHVAIINHDNSSTQMNYTGNDIQDNNDDDNRMQGEFIEGQDADMILMIQDDAILCHGLDATRWQRFPYVGAPWPMNWPPQPTQYFCRQWTRHWQQYHHDAWSYRHNHTTTMATNSTFRNHTVVGTDDDNESSSSSFSLTMPDYPTDMCTNPLVAPLGNGGLSIRSRYWLQEAIRYCPSYHHSGLSKDDIKQATCLVMDPKFQEDVYYGTILRGLFHNNNHSLLSHHHDQHHHHDMTNLHHLNLKEYRMPTIFEAALFATEMTTFMNLYHNKMFGKIPQQYSEENLVKQLWWNGSSYDGDDMDHHHRDIDDINGSSMMYHHEGWERYQRMKHIWITSNYKKPIISIGYHAMKKFARLTRMITSYEHYTQECPYLIDILPPKVIPSNKKHHNTNIKNDSKANNNDTPIT